MAANLAGRIGEDGAREAECNDGSCSFKAPSGKYYALVTVPGTPPVRRVVPVDASKGSARSTSEVEFNTEPPIRATWPLSDLFVNDVNKVKVYENQPDGNGVNLVDITGKTEENGIEKIQTGKEIGKEVTKPSGGEYAVSQNR